MTMNSEIELLMTLATKHLAQGDAETANACLSGVLTLQPHHLTAHNLREAHALPGNYGSWMGVNAQISPDDDIFRFFASHPTSTHPIRDYLSDGWRTMTELQVLMEQHGHVLGQSKAFLEFASGHGRFTRHLVKRLPQGALTVSDVVPGSVGFLQDLLGVQGFYSTPEPHHVQFLQAFEHIFVLSLFSHLPQSTWGDWLAQLYGALRPGGLLIFSTHGLKCAEQAGVQLQDGYAFFDSSESSAIPGQAYGTTFTSPDFVLNTARRVLGNNARVSVVPHHFWGNQDAVVIQG
ncbi:class I SAM-dependent methyltransferase [Limnohabitans sp. 2KL-51]|uniref:class I SAM-dependent methyltransferase n=1 Tax=Limnohabitans sp. 2KL-51 TaxID=1977911 RepID=UPI000D39ADCA|nr:class I SAM-dependent methyltransferase [Limnohabitans sp. 2KL-51]